MRDLGKAIVLFLHYDGGRFPHADAERAIAGFGRGDAIALLARIHAILEEMARIEIDWTKHTLASAGDEIRAAMKKRHSGLPDDALGALRGKFGVDWK